MSAGKFFVLLFICSFIVFVPGSAQKSKTQLQKEKQQNLQKIKEVEKILSETSNKKKNSIGELNALNERIKEQENLINGIKQEISLLDVEIGENKDIIDALESDLRKLKAEYASMLYAAQKANNSATRLTFLFSAESFDQMMMRLRYMQQYSQTRKLQAEQIVKVQEELSGQVKVIESIRTVKSTLLDEQISESNNLTELKTKQSALVKSLEKEEKSLRKDLDDTKKAIASLDKLLDEIIKEEMARAAKAAKTPAAAKTETNVVLSSSFEANKAKFAWPVSGFVTQKFGRQNHPVLKGIVIQNDGVNIQTQQGEQVKCIFEGVVSAIVYTQGFGQSVVISHGEYFTVYTGLKDISVRKGQKVNTGQELGKVQAAANGVSELRFRIYNNNTALDPQVWLAKS